MQARGCESFLAKSPALFRGWEEAVCIPEGGSSGRQLGSNPACPVASGHSEGAVLATSLLPLCTRVVRERRLSRGTARL